MGWCLSGPASCQQDLGFRACQETWGQELEVLPGTGPAAGPGPETLIDPAKSATEVLGRNFDSPTWRAIHWHPVPRRTQLLQLHCPWGVTAMSERARLLLAWLSNCFTGSSDVSRAMQARELLVHASAAACGGPAYMVQAFLAGRVEVH